MSPFLSFSSHLLLLILIFHIPTSTSTQERFLYVQCSVNTSGNTNTPVTNYTINSTFHTNLKQLLPSLAATVSLNNGFYNTYFGQEPNKVYGLVSCRSDTSPDVCRDCSTEASNSILSQCQSRSSAIWYNYCELVYSDTDFFLSSTTPWWFWVWSPNNVTDTELVPFQTALKTLMSDLASKAAYKPLLRKFATGEKNYLGIKKVYGLVQCKLVISGEDCYRCLVDAINMLPKCCDRRIGGRVAGLVCNIRFETTKFFKEISLVAGPAPFPPPTVALPPLTDQTNAGRGGDGGNPLGRKRKLLLIIAAIVIVGVSLLGTIMYCLWRKINKNDDTKMHNNSSDVSIFGEKERKDIDVPFYEFGSVLQATENFSDSNKLGQGGFGHVYKGKLSEGQELAVKRLSKSSGQGQEEFKNEVMLIAKLQHRNLVRLLGYCIQGDERILLYEYMPNKSLDYFLFDPNRSKLLSWEKRHNIILGLAKGLLYLHEDSRLRIIHRDLKTSNILLDEEMKPKISDFGMARIFDVNQNQANTNRVVGTYGYMSPEYAFHGLFSVKSDVFSFGVILLEIISGKKNSLFYHNEESLTLLGYAWKLLEEEKWMDFIDVNFKEACTLAEVLKCLLIALLCVQENTVDRPTMASVVRMFISEATTLQPPKQPAFITRNLPNPNSSNGSKNEITTSILEGR